MTCVQQYNPEAEPLAICVAALGQDAPSIPDSSFACIGDAIDVSVQDGFLRGHGTQVVDGVLSATVVGMVQRVNKLVVVQPLRNRYVADLGDVLVGRITEVAMKRWKVDISAQQDSVLQLSAVNLPGGIQRRRTAEDELNMRSLYSEGDLISAEVQAFFADGAVALHTRSLKYGKLETGQLVRVAHSLIRRKKMHFTQSKAIGVDIIFGVNGWVWVAPYREKPAVVPGGLLPSEDAAAADAAPPPPPVTDTDRRAISRAANAVRALAALQLPIHLEAVAGIVELADSEGVRTSHMMRTTFLKLAAAQEASNRSTEQ